MEKLNAKQMILQAGERLRDRDTKPLVILHAGVTVGAALVVTLLQYALAQGIGNTGGLSGMGTRSILETMQLVLQWANTLLLPFWNLGFLYVALLWARQKRTEKGDLLMGFRRIGPCIGLMVNRALLTFAVMFVCANLCTGIYMAMPAAQELTELATASGGDVDAFYAALEQIDMTDLLRMMAPFMILWGAVSLALLIPLLYRFRMAEFVILDEPRARGLSSMLLSAALLRRRCWQLFQLDLRFWWYYGLKVLCTVLLYGDLFLEAAGISLPVSGDGVYLLTYGLYLLGLFAVEVAFRPRVETAYGCAYETLKGLGPVQKPAQPVKPQDLPWDTEE